PLIHLSLMSGPPMFFSLIPPPPPSPLFPYTTLFRSGGPGCARARRPRAQGRRRRGDRDRSRSARRGHAQEFASRRRPLGDEAQRDRKSNTSELQSRENLVCRLLLEKKKKRIRKHNAN